MSFLADGTAEGEWVVSEDGVKYVGKLHATAARVHFKPKQGKVRRFAITITEIK